MPVTVIVGGQFGSEGKGKVAYYLAQKRKVKIAVRVGGSNSGHTIINSYGKPVIFRHLPVSSLLPGIISILPAGSYLDVDVLLAEVEQAKLSPNRLLIDPSAVIITQEERLVEQHSKLKASIGSTNSGTGEAVKNRVERRGFGRTAMQERLLRKFIKPVIPFMRAQLTAGNRIILEGTQGFGLSLLHSDDYPYVTSRDTTAASFLSEAGLSPLDVDEVVMVLRAYPIRVGGNSGPLPWEINWQTISSESKSSKPIMEYTSVTQIMRRVARFHPDVVRKAILVNRPTCFVLNHLDYVDTTYLKSNSLSEKVVSFINKIESSLNIKINYFGFSPSSLIPRQFMERNV